MATAEGIGCVAGRKDDGLKLSLVDIERAYCHALATREILIRLPLEDHWEGMRGKIMKSICFARDAAGNWEDCYVDFLAGVGFNMGVSRALRVRACDPQVMFNCAWG